MKTYYVKDSSCFYDNYLEAYAKSTYGGLNTTWSKTHQDAMTFASFAEAKKAANLLRKKPGFGGIGSRARVVSRES